MALNKCTFCCTSHPPTTPTPHTHTTHTHTHTHTHTTHTSQQLKLLLQNILDGQHPLLLLLRGAGLQQIVLFPVIDGPGPHPETTGVVPFLLRQSEVLNLELVLEEVEAIRVLLLGDDDPLVEEEELPLVAHPPATLAHDKLVLCVRKVQ